jgi:hypothetical protein
LSKEDAGVYAESVRRGGTMVVVKTNDAKRIEVAQAVMDRNSPIDLRVRADEYRSEGWKGYDAAAAPYTSSDEAGRPARRI